MYNSVYYCELNGEIQQQIIIIIQCKDYMEDCVEYCVEVILTFLNELN